MEAFKGENVVWAYDNEPATTWLNQRNNSNFFQNTEVFEEHRLECNILGASILMPEDFVTAYEGVIAAVQNGTIDEARINDSLTRILRVKYGEELQQ